MSYCHIITVIILFATFTVYNEYFSNYTSVIKHPHKQYDYIIVGAGTAGSILASRLSRDLGNKVLLVEAGGHINYFVRVPLAPTIAQKGANDWSFQSARQRFSSFGMINQTQLIPRGKGLGGSGQINYLMHGVGLASDFDSWARLNVTDWSLHQINPYFQKIFGTTEWEFDSETHCWNGCKNVPMQLKTLDRSNSLMQTLRQASEQADLNKKAQFNKPTATLRDGTRWSSYEAFLKPVLRRSNLHVLLDTQAFMVGFDGNVASSVYILQKNLYLDNIFATKEIILCAGAVKTPQILMLSGIGPRKIIEKNKLIVRENNAYVGRNLHDNLNMPLYVSIQKPISITLDKLFTFKSIWEYIWRNSGPLSFPPLAGIEIFNNETALTLFAFGSANENLLRDLSNYKKQSFRKTFPYYANPGKEGFIFLATCLQPKSRGYVSIKSNKMNVQPKIDPNYLSHPYDVKCMIRAIHRAVTLISTKAFQDIGARIYWPKIERCLHFWNADDINDSYLECIVREMAVTAHHVGGSCSIGNVVDHKFRVKSIERLRIVDSSVLPAPISLFPNSFLIAMADRAADFILIDNK